MKYRFSLTAEQIEQLYEAVADGLLKDFGVSSVTLIVPGSADIKQRASSKSYSVESHGHVVVVALNDNGTGFSILNELLLDPQINKGQPIILDCQNMKVLTSADVSYLITFNKKIKDSGGRVVLVNVPQVIKDMFALLHLDKLLAIADDVASAIHK
ncbi:MAG TPA: STAS domain-containing protein [Gemmataceae bacterium]|jgi:anti-anti-sigma factor|nr:STAS domain-containing protein [Gemmataceae bacterium]